MRNKKIKLSFIIVLSAVFIFSAFKVVSLIIEFKSSRDTYSDLREIYSPSQTLTIPETPTNSYKPDYSYLPLPSDDPEEFHKGEEVVNNKFSELIKINEDFIGWIEIPGTKISYPVVQGEDNDFYLNHLFSGEKNITGSIYLDFRNNLKGNDNQLLIYGHSMRDGSMFAEINSYANNNTRIDYFNNKSLIIFDTIYGEMKFQIYSSYVVKLNEESFLTRVRYSNTNDYLEYLNSTVARSLTKKEVSLNKDSVILTLATCSPWFENSRTLVHAVLID